MPGRPQQAPQNTGATTPSEKFSARTLDGRAADAGLVEESRITTNDLRDRHAPGIDTPTLQPAGHRRDMSVQTALREQAGGEQRQQQQAQPTAEQTQRQHLQQDHGEHDDEEDEQQSRHAAKAPPRI